VEELLDILAHGNDAQVAARVYDVESLSESARRIPLSFLRTLRAPRPDLRLEVVERHRSGRFDLLILWVSWFAKADEPGSGYHPLLVTEQGGTLRAVGFVLPWNEVIPQLGAEMSSVTPLSVIWITRSMAFKSGARPAEPDAPERPLR
jgi:hypothetical protein